MNCSTCGKPIAGTKVIHCRRDSFCAYCSSCAATARVPDIEVERATLRGLAKKLEADPFYRIMTPPDGIKAVRLP
jgi:hypothetical protein